MILPAGLCVCVCVFTCLSLCVFVPQTAEQAYRQIQNIVDFSSNVMSSLLGEKFIHSGVRWGRVFYFQEHWTDLALHH